MYSYMYEKETKKISVEIIVNFEKSMVKIA